MFDIPTTQYGVEKIINMLLDPGDPALICKARPTNIQQSATFVIDLDKLEHPDDPNMTTSVNGTTLAHILFHFELGTLRRVLSVLNASRLGQQNWICSTFVVCITLTLLILAGKECWPLSQVRNVSRLWGWQ